MRSLCRNAGRTTFYALRIKYSANFIGTLHGCCTVSRLVFFVFQDTFFSSFEVHGPTTFPIMSFARELVENVTSVAVLQASDLVSLEFNGFQNLRLGAFILKLLHDEECRVELTYKA